MAAFNHGNNDADRPDRVTAETEAPFVAEHVLDAFHASTLYGAEFAIVYFDATIAFDAVFDSQHFPPPAEPVPDPDELEAGFNADHVLDAVFTASFSGARPRIHYFDATVALQALFDQSGN